MQSKINIFRFSWAILALLFYQISTSQEIAVLANKKLYLKKVQQDSSQAMVEVKTIAPGIRYDLRYATKQNFTGKKLYRRGNKTFLRLLAARALQKVEEELKQKGFTLKIWDAYRPYSITKEMWDLIGDERYVANPAKGSGHNRGLAVDVTVVKEGKELNMGTGFDNFTDTAHHTFTNLPADVLKNRELLKSTMEKYGFKALETEWWHYSFLNDKNYDVLDLSFRELAH